VPALPEKNWTEREGPVRLNQVARRVMAKHGVAIDDLYSLIRPPLAEHQKPDDLHFNAAGYRRLGPAAAEAILAALPAARDPGAAKP